MNEQNLNNVIVIDRISKKVLNDPQIEIDEEVYADGFTVSGEIIGSFKGEERFKETNPEVCVFISKARQQKNFATINLQTNLFTALTVKYPKTVIYGN